MDLVLGYAVLLHYHVFEAGTVLVSVVSAAKKQCKKKLFSNSKIDAFCIIQQNKGTWNQPKQWACSEEWDFLPWLYLIISDHPGGIRYQILISVPSNCLCLFL